MPHLRRPSRCGRPRAARRPGGIVLSAVLAVFVADAGRGAAGVDLPPAADAAVLADRPLAVWRFEDAAESAAAAERFPAGVERPDDTGTDGTSDTAQIASAAERLLAAPSGTVARGEPGPRPPRHPSFTADNHAAVFGGGRGFLKVTADTPRFGEFQFTAGDSITLEAWVSPLSIDDGQQVYLIGKGRTNRGEMPVDNQNWALRLTGKGGLARPSFLFRGAGDGAGKGAAFYRWTATEGIEPGTGWHHVAVSYTFGEKDSLRGYLDGRPVDGTWDLGGATTAPPVVDDDEIWIGSSMGGGEANTLSGGLDNVAVHRRVLPAERIAARWQVNEEVPAVPEVVLAPVPAGAVLFELLEGIPDANGWRFAPREPSESFTRAPFALLDLPHRYDDAGLRVDRRLPLVMRARATVAIPPGPQTLRLRARGEARLVLDGKELARLEAPGQRTDGHEPMFTPDRSGPEGIRFVQPGDREAVVAIEGDGALHAVHVEVKVGRRGRRPELGEFSVSLGPPAAVPAIVTFAAAPAAPSLTDAGWSSLAARLAAEADAANTQTRRAAAARQAERWERRHAEARTLLAGQPAGPVPPIPADRPGLAAATVNEIDRFVNARLAAADVAPAAAVDDAAFIRRLSLDVRGVIPTPDEIGAFLADTAVDRRQRLVDRFLADPRWADHWVPFWQDLLAENPNLVNPTLNNTGPFRFFIHESFLDRKPIDRFVTELIMMDGSKLFGGPGGFGLATENDAPMAAKAHIIGRAFLGIEMGCARCHDAPGGAVDQEDLFSLAAMLKRAPEKVPATSSVPVSPERLAAMSIKVTLAPGTTVPPAWPFSDVVPAAAEIAAASADSRERLAAVVTSPANPRFARVIVNRLWARYLGRGLVDDLDDWHGEAASDPDLLGWLARQFVLSDYRLEEVARLILSSHTYSRGLPDANGAESSTGLFAGRPPRRMSAEQIIDSLAVASGKPFDVEPMNIDVDTSRPATMSLNLGPVTRAWQFVALGNERDRPSLSLPFAQHSVAVLEAFGWRGERQSPITHRDESPNALQPAILANGVAVKRASQFSDSSIFTAAALEDRSVEDFVDDIFLRTLSRLPTDRERTACVAVVGPGYDMRRLSADRVRAAPAPSRPVGVSWSNHLTEEANEAKRELARIAAAGDPPTGRLDPAWRERAEDLVWTLFNAPEFLFTP